MAKLTGLLRGKSIVVLLALLVLVPMAMILAISTHSGGRFLKGPKETPKAAAILPGMTLDDASAPGGGLVVTSIRTNSRAAARGVRVGDTLIAIDGQRVRSLAQARRYLTNDKGRHVDLKLVRGPILRDVRLGLKGA